MVVADYSKWINVKDMLLKDGQIIWGQYSPQVIQIII